MKNRKLLAANWKMHLSLTAAQALASETTQLYAREVTSGLRVVLAVPHPYLLAVRHLCKDHPNLAVAAQNLHQEAQGAYTGEVSAEMIASCGAEYVIVGHSERRLLYGETDELLLAKTQRALAAGLHPIYCIGETLTQREAGQTEQVIEHQLHTGVLKLNHAQLEKVVIAYEPVWAIGTGRNATPEQAQDVHADIRAAIATQFGATEAQAISILYGGSVKADNARALFAMPDIDGALVGGASLSSRSFIDIALAL